MAGVEPALSQGLVVVFRFVRAGKEAPQQFLRAGVLALLEQRLGMVWILDILVAVVAALMARDESLPVV